MNDGLQRAVPHDQSPVGSPATPQLLKLSRVSKSYLSGSKRLDVICDLDLDLAKGEFLAVVGRSGCGKTTLLNLIAGMDRVDSGRIFLLDAELTTLDAKGWDRVRQTHIGFIFQSNQLLPEFTAVENAMLPGLIARQPEEKIRVQARELLTRVGLHHRLDHKPAQLSGGEQQRVAIARALLNGPDLILADEPTGSLDLDSGQDIFNILKELQRDLGLACVLVTHNPELARCCDRIFSLTDGRGVQ